MEPVEPTMTSYEVVPPVTPTQRAVNIDAELEHEWDIWTARVDRQLYMNRLAILGLAGISVSLIMLVRMEMKAISNITQAVQGMMTSPVPVTVPPPVAPVRYEAPIDETPISTGPIAPPTMSPVQEASERVRQQLAADGDLSQAGQDPLSEV